MVFLPSLWGVRENLTVKISLVGKCGRRQPNVAGRIAKSRNNININSNIKTATTSTKNNNNNNNNGNNNTNNNNHNKNNIALCIIQTEWQVKRVRLRKTWQAHMLSTTASNNNNQQQQTQQQ
ncbi:unnamed protein product [Polarella glacialis]|uniref:Uncharacterized protein n=1 Tax=Polarella glacialis TaxID=89957 RepID=A0A813J465_POLGL|nr:unnamed protein product [Polarella glacialis]